MRLLGPGVARVVRATLEQFSIPLLQVLEMDVFGLRSNKITLAPNGNRTSYYVIIHLYSFYLLVLAITLDDTVGTSTPSFGYPKKIFAHFRDQNISTTLSQICRVLGYYGDLMFLCDHFVSSFLNENNVMRKQVCGSVLRFFAHIFDARLYLWLTK